MTTPEASRGSAPGVDEILVVNEIFGPTIQGEGASSGRRCAFLRLGGCNLACRWCDTPYTWDWRGESDSGVRYHPSEQLHPMEVGEIAGQLRALNVPLIVISGGEPLSQQRRLLPLLGELARTQPGVKFEIETNGTIAPIDELSKFNIRFNVSPKLSHSGMAFDRRVVPAALEKLGSHPDSIYKFVCGSRGDLDEVGEIVDRFDIDPVWIMPLGRTSGEIVKHMKLLIPDVIARGWNMTPRLHILLWGDVRGV